MFITVWKNLRLDIFINFCCPFSYSNKNLVFFIGQKQEETRYWCNIFAYNLQLPYLKLLPFFCQRRTEYFYKGDMRKFIKNQFFPKRHIKFFYLFSFIQKYVLNFPWSLYINCSATSLLLSEREPENKYIIILFINR